MKSLLLAAVATFSSVFVLPACAEIPANAIPPLIAAGATSPVAKTMRPFKSDQEIAAYLKQLAQRQRRGRQMAEKSANSAAPAPSLAGTLADSSKDESITNVQHAGVDEGGIVKLHGDHLVVLRRGRLFTVAVGDDALKPISVVDAFAPDIDPRNTWYDEMLVSNDTVAVIGYSYERGGTEVGLFNIDDAGKLSYRSTYHLRSNDYYSSRNYASRLIGNKLIFYTPLYLYDYENAFQSFPAVRRWHKGATLEEFERIVAATHVYRPERNLEMNYGMALHTVTVCDLSGGGFKCEATGVLGPAGRVFYVSPEAVYVWVTDWVSRGKETKQQSMVYRMPLDGSSPSALGVAGSPVDQFSFLESADGYLNVLIRADSAGDGMWAAEFAAGDVALLRVPLTDFSDGSQDVFASNYRKLPNPSGYTFENRFVNEYLLYGTGNGWGYPQTTGRRSTLVAVKWAGGDIHQILLPHGVDRIEQLGNDAVVIGTSGRDLQFSSIRLGEWPEVADRYTRKDASQGETRSQGFFYKPDGPDSGTLGLPISVPLRPGYQQLFESSAAILFLRNSGLHFEEAGELASRPDKAIDDSCRASCVDWYGNSRPLFFHGRVLALMGYEIVEGAINDGRMRELRRINYAPARPIARSAGE